MTTQLPNWDWLDLGDNDGNVHSPVAGRRWVIPAEVVIRRGRLLYHLSGWDQLKRVQPKPSLLADFLTLADCEPERIVKFGQKWGVLGLCHHGLPSPHEALSGSRPWTRRVDCFPGRLRRGWIRTGSEPIPDLWLWEPLEAWRYYAMLARAMLNLVAALRQGQKGRREDWLILTPIPPTEATGSIDTNPWRYLGSALEKWFEGRPMTLSIRLSDNGQLSLDLNRAANSLFVYLRLQLAFAVGGGGGLALCASCGNLYQPRRRPNPNRLSFCRKCGRTASERLASVRYRQSRSLKRHT